MTEQPTPRELQLETAFLELLQLLAQLRHRQKYWQEHYGYDNKKYKVKAEEALDKVLEQIGVDEHTDFRRLNIKFLHELSVEEQENLLKKLQ